MINVRESWPVFVVKLLKYSLGTGHHIFHKLPCNTNHQDSSICLLYLLFTVTLWFLAFCLVGHTDSMQTHNIQKTFSWLSVSFNISLTLMNSMLVHLAAEGQFLGTSVLVRSLKNTLISVTKIADHIYDHILNHWSI